MESLPLEDKSCQNPLDPKHPKNQKCVHDLILNDELEATKDYNELIDSRELGTMLNKKLKCVKAFKKPEFDWNDENVKKDKDAGKIYYSTYRNGFVSACAMAYNFHLPLILSPLDIWLTVM